MGPDSPLSMFDLSLGIDVSGALDGTHAVGRASSHWGCGRTRAAGGLGLREDWAAGGLGFAKNHANRVGRANRTFPEQLVYIL